jgi:hypothetical protein
VTPAISVVWRWFTSGRLPSTRRARAAAAAPSRPLTLLLIRGLLAALEGRADEGLALAGQARDEVPWDIRPVLLSGRIHLGLAYGREDAGDVDGALAELERAGAFFESAVTIGRSDPDAHTDLCRRWSDEVRIRDRAGRPSDVVFQRATAHCDQAVAVAPDLADPHIALARLLWQRADGLPGAAPEASEHLDAAIAAAGRAVGLEPKWGEAHHALGTATRIRSRRVEDPETALTDAPRRHREPRSTAVELEPGNAVFLDDLAYAHDRRARILMRLRRGSDPGSGSRPSPSTPAPSRRPHGTPTAATTSASPTGAVRCGVGRWATTRRRISNGPQRLWKPPSS